MCICSLVAHLCKDCQAWHWDKIWTYQRNKGPVQQCTKCGQFYDRSSSAILKFISINFHLYTHEVSNGEHLLNICTNSNKIDHFYTLRLFVVEIEVSFSYLHLIYYQPTLVYVCWKFVCNVNSCVIWNTLTDINNGYRTMYPNVSMVYVPISGAQSAIREEAQRKHVCTVEANVCNHTKKIWTPPPPNRTRRKIHIKYK